MSKNTLQKIVQLPEFQRKLAEAARLSIEVGVETGFHAAVRYTKKTTGTVRHSGRFVLSNIEMGEDDKLGRDGAGYGVYDGYTDVLGVHFHGAEDNNNYVRSTDDMSYLNHGRRLAFDSGAVDVLMVELIGVVGSSIQLLGIQEKTARPIPQAVLEDFMDEYSELEAYRVLGMEKEIVAYLNNSGLYVCRTMSAPLDGMMNGRQRKVLSDFDCTVRVDEARLKKLLEKNK